MDKLIDLLREAENILRPVQDGDAPRLADRISTCLTEYAQRSSEDKMPGELSEKAAKEFSEENRTVREYYAHRSTQQGVFVPREPTRDMFALFMSADWPARSTQFEQFCHQYKAMLKVGRNHMIDDDKVFANATDYAAPSIPTATAGREPSQEDLRQGEKDGAAPICDKCGMELVLGCMVCSTPWPTLDAKKGIAAQKEALTGYALAKDNGAYGVLAGGAAAAPITSTGQPAVCGHPKTIKRVDQINAAAQEHPAGERTVAVEAAPVAAAPTPEQSAELRRAVDSQRNDTRTDEQKIADGVEFIMGDTSAPTTSSAFSEFIRNASPEEKERVYSKVMDDAVKMQNKVVAPLVDDPRDPAIWRQQVAPTPRTDKHIVKILSSLQSGTEDVVKADFARQLEQELTEAKAELDQWTKWGTIEVAIRNPSVAEAMRHWEGRAEKAEAALADLKIKMAGNSRDYETLLAEANSKLAEFEQEPSAWALTSKHGNIISLYTEPKAGYKSEYDKGCRDMPLYARKGENQ